MISVHSGIVSTQRLRFLRNLQTRKMHDAIRERYGAEEDLSIVVYILFRRTRELLAKHSLQEADT